jgi:nitroreductase
MTPYQKRYGGQVPDVGVVPNEFISNILGRSSQRKFNGKPLDPGVLELLIAAAQSAPTSGMLQTWSVIALSTPEEKSKLFADTGLTPSNTTIIGGVDSSNFTAINTASVVLIWLADLSRVKTILEEQDVSERHRAQITQAEYHLKAIIDATIAAQTFFMAAESMGIAGTYCGAIRQLPIEFLETEFNLPKHTFPVFGTIHGYSESNLAPLVKPRLPANLVLHHGSYSKMQNTSELAEYNKVHVKNSSKLRSTFEKRVVERLSPSYSKDAVGDALRHMGFDFN